MRRIQWSLCLVGMSHVSKLVVGTIGMKGCEGND